MDFVYRNERANWCVGCALWLFSLLCKSYYEENWKAESVIRA